VAKKNNKKKKKQSDLVPQRPIKREREKTIIYLHGNPKVTSVTMAPLSTYRNLILQSIICLCEKPNFTKKNWFLIIIAFPMTKKKLKTIKKKNSKIMTDDICSNQSMPS
jgi:hypothetical protein